MIVWGVLNMKEYMGSLLNNFVRNYFGDGYSREKERFQFMKKIPIIFAAADLELILFD